MSRFSISGLLSRVGSIKGSLYEMTAKGRKCEQQEERGNELTPNEEGHAEEGESGNAELDDGDDRVD